jgi:hypothetical protein
MSKDTTILVIASAAGLVSVAAWAVLILAPAWTAYPRKREKLAAAFLSLYVLAAMALVGVLAGAAVLYYYDEL